MTVISMSKKEFSRLDMLLNIEAGRVTIADATRLLGLRRRQVFRILAGFREHGSASLISKRRGHPSNHRLPNQVRELAMLLVKERYADFGPTLASEKLSELHGCHVSRETLRKWMIEDGLWLDRRQRLPSVHQPRYRRERVGELVQIDGSIHHWFENRGPECTLLAYIDDATSRLQHAAFVASESGFDYMRQTKAYIAKHGRPIAFYSDKHAIFRVNNRDAAGGSGMTQFGRALHELNIDIICANTPSAKGRVERSFGTLQDRLVKELRLEGVSTVDAANDFLGRFLFQYNSKFGKEPLDKVDSHRSISDNLNMNDAMAWKEERTVSNNLTLQYDKILFMLEPSPLTRPLARQRVTVIDYPDGTLAIKHCGMSLPYRIFDKLQKVDQAAIVENKRLGSVLAYIAEQQAERENTRSSKAPRRQGQDARHMFRS
jgi:hypothetical protein